MRTIRLILLTLCGAWCVVAAAQAQHLAFPGPPPGGPGLMTPEEYGPGDDGGCCGGGRPDPFGRDEYAHAVWTIGTEAMLLGREKTSGVVLARAGNLNLAGATRLDSSALDYDHELTPRFNAILHRDDGLDLGFSFFECEDWNSQAIVADTGANTISISAPNILLGGSNAARFSSESQLWSAELNVRFRVLPRLTLMAGGRALEFAEEFSAERNLNANSFVPVYNIDVRNRLIGVQIGGLGSIFQGEHLSLDAMMKWGYFHNEAKDIIRDLAGVGNLGVVTTEISEQSTLFEIGLYAAYRFNSQAKVYVGYNAMWLIGLATAPAQIASNDVFNIASAARLGTRGAQIVSAHENLTFEGTTVGFEFTY